ncbi:MAG: PIN domain-containing protein [Burkholderiales bacterium]
MTGLDSNVLVRYLAQDDAVQSARAVRLIENELSEREPGYISLVVLVETCWVLKRLYGATPKDIRETVRDLLDVRQFSVERRLCVSNALARLGEGTGDLADAIIAELASEAGCERIVTFDKSATKLGMILL